MKRPITIEWWVLKRVGLQWDWHDTAPTKRAAQKAFARHYKDAEPGTFRLCRIEAHEIERSGKAKK